MLAAGTAAQMSFSAISFGLAAIAPRLRDEFDLSLERVGVLLAAEWVGLTFAQLPWGLLTDRIGERVALAVGLGTAGLLLASVSLVESIAAALVLLALAGAAGGSVQSASGRAVMHRFAPAERGLAFGIRQTAVTVGGVVGALAVPAIAIAAGVDAAFLFLGALCSATALLAGVVVRDTGRGEHATEAVPWTLRDGRLWRLCAASALYVAAQVVLVSFLVLYLHDERGFSERGAAALLAVVLAVAAVLRIAAGRWSDVLRSRVVPLRRIGLAITATLGAATLALDPPTGSLRPCSSRPERSPRRGTASRSRPRPSSPELRGAGPRSAFSRRR